MHTYCCKTKILMQLRTLDVCSRTVLNEEISLKAWKPVSIFARNVCSVVPKSKVCGKHKLKVVSTI